MPRLVECPWLSAAPTVAPMWIIGPSGPTGRPEPTAQAQDANLTSSVRKLKTCSAFHTGFIEWTAAGDLAQLW